jgi:molecular chaperone HtpG
MMGANAMPWMNGMPEIFHFKINANHPIISKLKNMLSEEDRKARVKELSDLAMLSQGLLKGEALDKFLQSAFNRMLN